MASLDRFAFASLLLTATLGFAAPGGTQPVIVDCDAGDNLAKALAEAEPGRLTRIQIRGTCHGSFTIDNARIDLRGEGPGRSAIVSAEFETALTITGQSGVATRDLEIRGGSIGIRVMGRNSNVSILFCEVSADDVAVWVSGASSAFVNGAVLHDSAVGLFIDDRSSGTLFFATTRDNRISGATVNDHSSLHVTNSEISGNGQIGLSVEKVSTITVHESTLSNNGEAHAYANDRSRLHLHTQTTVGDEDDTTAFALGVNRMSQLKFNDIIVHGDVFGSNASYFSSAISTIRGSVLLDDFSNFRIFSGEIDGTVRCRSGADAFCNSATVALTDGCASAEPVCGASSLDPVGPVDPRLDRLDKLLDRAGSRKFTARPQSAR